MTPDTIFQLCSAIAFVAWLLLIVASPFWPAVDKFLIGVVISLLALIYTWLIFTTFNPAAMREFATLDGVTALFTNKKLVAAGWVHYLAFDLLTGIWMANNARMHGIRHWFAVPCLVCTFMLGPFGLLLYLLLRLAITRRWFAANY